MQLFHDQTIVKIREPSADKKSDKLNTETHRIQPENQ